MCEIYNPDWRYAGMTRTEIEEHVKARCSYLISRKHIIPEISGKKIKFGITEKDIEHLVSDALYRTKGVLFINDISSLPQFFPKAKYIKTEKETKKGKRRVCFHYYEININGRILFLNIREDKTYKMVRLYSITDKIQTTATLK